MFVLPSDAVALVFFFFFLTDRSDINTVLLNSDVCWLSAEFNFRTESALMNIWNMHLCRPLPRGMFSCFQHCQRITLKRNKIAGTVKPRITNNSVYEQIYRTQSVPDDVLCLELRTRKPSKRRQKQITLDNFLVRQRPSGSEADSNGAKRQKKEKESPSKQ